MNRTPRYATLVAGAAALALLTVACGSDADDTDASIPGSIDVPDVTTPDVTTPDITEPDITLES